MRTTLFAILAIGSCLLFTGRSVVADDAANLVGAWRLVSFAAEDAETKQQTPIYGEHPNGRIVFTGSRMVAILTAETRKPPQTEQDRSAAFASLVAYSGTYHVADATFTTKVDVAWNEAWVGTDQLRHYRIEGNTLYIETDPRPVSEFGNRTVRFLLSWEREN